MKSEATNEFATATLSIIVVNDEDSLLNAITVMLRNWLTNARVLSFKNSQTAWRILSRTDPDLLITHDRMPGLYGEEICQRLLTKKAGYPVIVSSAWPRTEQWVKESANRGLNIRFLECPFTIHKFRDSVESVLRTRDNEVS